MIVLEGRNQEPLALAFSPDGTMLASGGAATHVQMWDLATPGKAKNVLGPLGRHGAVIFLDSDHLLTATYHHGRGRGSIRLAARPFAQTLREIDGSTHFIHAVPTLDREAVILITKRPGEWNASWLECRAVSDLSLRWEQPRQGDAEGPIRLCPCPDGTIVVGLLEETQLIDPDTGTVLRRIATHPQCVPHLAVSADGRYLAVGSRQLAIIDIVSGNALACTQAPTRDYFQDLAFHPSGRLLLAATKQPVVRVYDTATLTEVAAFDWGIGKAQRVAFSPDGMRAAAAGEKGKVAIWDVDL